MADEDYDLVSYKDVSDLRRELEGMKDKRDVPSKDLHAAVQKLTGVMSDMLEMFAGAAEQMKLEEKEYETESRKHEMIVSKLDKLIEQNKTIAEAMVAIVDMVKEKFPHKEINLQSKENEEPMFKPAPEPAFNLPKQPEWKPKEAIPRLQPPMQPMMPLAPMMPQTSSQDFGMQMPSMQSEPMPDLDFPGDSFLSDSEPKKKSLFGMFKK